MIAKRSRLKIKLPKFKIARNKRRRPKKTANLNIEFTSKRRSAFKKLFLEKARVNYRTQRLLQSLFILALLALICGLVLFVFYSNFFRLRNIYLEDTHTTMVSSEEVGVALLEFKGQNIFLIRRGAIAKKVQNFFPQVKKISIKKILPNSIRVGMADYSVVATLSRDKQPTYLVNEAGVLTGHQQTEESLPHFIMAGEKELKIGEQVIQPKNLQYLILLDSKIKEMLDLDVKFVYIIEAAQEVHLRLSNDWKIKMNMNQDPTTTLEYLIRALHGYNVNELKFEYIDLRIPKKIYFKPLE